MRKTVLFYLLLIIAVTATNTGAFTEPDMAKFTAVPSISNQSVTPNVMIMLDNSGSMNYAAYGTYRGNGRTITDQPFTGKPYNAMQSFPILSGMDDAEEKAALNNALYDDNDDLDLGGFNINSNDSLVGIRIQNVDIPQGAVVLTAYLEFNAINSHSGDANFLIEGEASDNALPFAEVVDNLKNRTATAATVAWNNVQEWTDGQSYPTPDLTPIVQEIVNRAGWNNGNSMVFRFSGVGATENKRDIRSYDRSASLAPTLHVVIAGSPADRRYYGYFSPDHFYRYDGQRFNLVYEKVDYNYGSQQWDVLTLGGSSQSLSNGDIVSNSLWDGNWLNWLSMRRVDVLRKVLMGGLATTRDGSGRQVNQGEIMWWRDYAREFNPATIAATSPYSGNTRFYMEGGMIRVDTNSDGNFDDDYNIQVQKDDQYEPSDFLERNLAGVLQRVGDKARWGNSWFNIGTGTNQSGGKIDHVIGTDISTMITDLQTTPMTTWTPLAESFYVTMQYFRQEDPQGGLDYPSDAVPNDTPTDDPYYNGSVYVPCAKSFVILLTDGASTRDGKIPDAFKDFDGDGTELGGCTETNCNYPGGGSDYLDDLAFFARTQDLRGDLDGDQHLILYAIHAFDRDPNATSLLMDAARNGGFIDMNDNNQPDLVQEYDRDSDGVPDTFFEADDGYAIEARLLTAITDILKRASSGTAASVLATNSEGEGNMLQAYYLPYITQGLEEAQWFGFLHSLWVDSYGNLFEDSNQNLTFDSSDDQITFTIDSDNDTAFVRNNQIIKLNEQDPNLRLKPIFAAGQRLAERPVDQRKIFTFVDKDRDGVADEAGNNPFDNAGEVVAFDTSNSNTIKPYLGVRADITWGDTGAGFGTTHDVRTDNLITWVRGTDVQGLRNRTLDNVTWRLGDIVHSTPVSVSRPVEKFHLWYADASYRDYYDAYKDREGVVYVGSNDGMLHAFTSWKYDTEDKQYKASAAATANGEKIGDELWAYIPQSVLPHLKWTASEDYTHTYLVDGKPRIFDAKILPDDTHYTDSDGDDNWGTILVMGLNMGAMEIKVNEDFNDGNGVAERDFYPTYICMDITEPRSPRLLWEKSYPNQGMSYATPVPVKVDDEWYLAFGSGPTKYDGSSTQSGSFYIVDMKNGDLLKQHKSLDNNAFFTTAAAFDKNLNYNVDGIYAGNTYWDGANWRGGMYKIAVPCSNCEWVSNHDPAQDLGYTTDPAGWTAHKLFDSGSPITAAPSISVESYPSFDVDNVWIYFGTGRYLNDDDKTSTEQQYLYGIKDPLFNKMYKTTSQYCYAASSSFTVDSTTLFPSAAIVTTTEGRVLKNGNLFNGTGDFPDLVDDIRENYDGWYRPLDTPAGSASERMISKPSVYGGISFFTTFSPSTDICKSDGSTNFYAVYYTTGTGYIKQIFDIQNPETVTYTHGGQSVTDDVVAVKLEDALTGAPPPSVGLHTGKEDGAKAYIQLSTGVVELIDVQSALYMKSTITDWWDRTD